MAMRAGDRAAAARSIELIGKHLGMFIDRKQIDIAYVDDADEYLAKIMALVDAKTVVVVDSNYRGGNGWEAIASHTLSFDSTGSYSDLGTYRSIDCVHTGGC